MSNVKMSKGDLVADVNQNSVEIMKGNGWKVVDEPASNEGGEGVNYAAMTKAELQAALTEKGIEFPPSANKADLLALLQS